VTLGETLSVIIGDVRRPAKLSGTPTHHTQRSGVDQELDVEQLIRRSGMPRDLGIEFADLFPIRVVATIPVDDRHLRPLGFLHGGVSVTLAESVATVGAWLNCPPGKMALASSVNASYLRPKRSGGRLVAVGIPDHIGSEKQVWDVDIRDESGERVCASRCTLAVVDFEPECVPTEHA
jgi:1,4-dihydroxy-2-naphthoyl-CoA hydrolase